MRVVLETTSGTRDVEIRARGADASVGCSLPCALPYVRGAPYAAPASNREIANDVYLGVDAVKNHLRILFQRFGIGGLPQNQKRARLVELAFELGVVQKEGG